MTVLAPMPTSQMGCSRDLDAGEEVGVVVLAVVELHLGVGEVFALGEGVVALERGALVLFLARRSA